MDNRSLDGCIVWNAHKNILGEEVLLIAYTSFRHAT